MVLNILTIKKGTSVPFFVVGTSGGGLAHTCVRERFLVESFLYPEKNLYISLITKQHPMKYFGIADAHGIESFIQGDPTDINHSVQAMVLDLRAGANRHRHAVVFIVDISESTAQDIDDLLEEGDYIGALVRLKMSVETLQLTNLPGAEKSWRLIPNSDLDPYS